MELLDEDEEIIEILTKCDDFIDDVPTQQSVQIPLPDYECKNCSVRKLN